MSGDDQAIAANVRVELARRNIKHSTVATAIGMRHQSFSNRCNGRTRFTAAQLVQIAAVIDCPVEDLFRLDDKASA